LLYCLHPNDLASNEDHMEKCLVSFAPSAVFHSAVAHIECGICGGLVAQQPDPRFGLLNCEHAFCLGCIRFWRSTQSATDANGEFTNEYVPGNKGCPLCPVITHFVIPSATWTTDPEEKQQIIENYKRKVGQIDCKYFNYGLGNCPFGGGCFYAHRSAARRSDTDRVNDYDITQMRYKQGAGHEDRIGYGMDTQARALRETRLSDFIDFSFQQTLNRKGKQKNNKK
jgi:hypothetical protein